MPPSNNTHIYITVATAICSIISLIGNMVGVIIMLYVRSEVKPLAIEIRVLNSNQSKIESTQGALWEKIGQLGQRMSRMEGRGEAEEPNDRHNVKA